MGLIEGHTRYSLSHSRYNKEPQPHVQISNNDPIPSPSPTSRRQPTSVSEQTSELLKTTDHIRTQLREVERLRQLHDHILGDDERAWIDSTIQDIAGAARDVAVLIEPTRVEVEARNGKLSLGRQLRWICRDRGRAQDKRVRLLACYQSLMAVLERLQRLGYSTEAAVYELDAGSVAKSLSESREVASELEGEVKAGVSGPPNYEMYDMLAWRRSRGAATSKEIDHCQVRTTTGDVGVS
ncbi:uncharacterized protein BDW43DRAFT_263656 [Aspergillus alliaceus]|uniref:uncharacterized protein n=1 Tax=Petromyces alliaceus TaxID=209559 RepID=UPI0012A66891|nr:uncharacterized protein BDW43DRAFT_263656 [Aspergillus alliaceus]KAB8237559.1 hypothetical protein BDW43DRAFT_263656 [Aspergillus alliaceus]